MQKGYKRKGQNNEEVEEEQEIDGFDISKTMNNEELVNVDFDFYDSNPNQYFSVKNLINGLFDGQSYDSSELANLIVNQGCVGTMIGIYDEEEEQKMLAQPLEFQQRDILGFSTIISLDQNKEVKVIQKIAQYVLEMNQKHNSNSQQFVQILQNKKIGLLFNERVLNMSPKLVPILHNQVQEDLAWLEKEDAMIYKNFVFDYILILSKCNQVLKNQNKKLQQNELQNYLFSKFEDYQFLSVSENYFMFHAQSGKKTSGITNVEKEQRQEICYNTIALVKYSDFQKSIQLLPSYIE